MKRNGLEIIKSAVLLSVFTACMMVSVNDVKAATPCGCNEHEYEVSDDTITISNISGHTAGIKPACIKSLISDTVNKVVISEGVTLIESSAFSDCYKLESITIPSSVTTINEHAFQSCTSLTSVSIPDSGLNSIGQNAFSNCKALTSITIPDSVTSIERSAFGLCENLTSINIPSNITSILYGTFSDCKALTSIIIPAGVTSIGDSAFDGCESLEGITIPDGVTSISQCAFARCKGLTSITIPAGVTSIGSYSFGGCTSLNEITIKGKVLSVCNDESGKSFADCTPKAVIFDNSDATKEELATIIQNVITSSGMNISNLNSIVVPDTMKAEVLAKLNEDISDDALKTNITSTLKTQTAYETEKNSKPVSNDTNDEQEEKKTASEDTPTVPSKSVYEEKMDSLIQDISLATKGDKKSSDTNKTIYLKDVNLLPLSVMKALKSNPIVNLDMTYTYNGIVFHVVIPAGTAVFDEKIPWYGPLWLYTHYGQGTLTNVNSNSTNIYTVQSGDTLRKIAAKYGMALEELLKKNPQIKNIDKISIGDKINI